MDRIVAPSITLRGLPTKGPIRGTPQIAAALSRLFPWGGARRPLVARFKERKFSHQKLYTCRRSTNVFMSCHPRPPKKKRLQKKKKKKTGPAIRVAIRQQFPAIRTHFRQFGCSMHTKNVGDSAIRSPDSFPFKILKRGSRRKNPWAHCTWSNTSRILPHNLGERGDGVLEFYHGHCW